MPRPSIRHLLAAGALALIATAPLAACRADSVSPLPVEVADTVRPATATANPTPSGTPKAPPTGVSPPHTARPPTGTRPTKTKTVKPTHTKPTSSCLGAVRYDLDLHNTVLDLIKSMCFHTGGVLRLQGIGPGLVTATPESLVSQNYEGGVVDLRFIRPGTVTVTIPQDERTYTITVVVRG
jgi:hypothetical protein